MSLIPIGFFCYYMARKINARVIKTGYASVGLVVLYFISVGFDRFYGPIYDVNRNAETIFFIMNSLFVFAFLIFYSQLIIILVMNSESNLENMALYDSLTGLFNRYCLMEKMREMEETKRLTWIAIIDIDRCDMLPPLSIPCLKWGLLTQCL